MEKPELENLLTEWKIRITKAQVGHYMAAEKHIRWHYVIGITLIVLSTFVSSTLFLQPEIIIINQILIAASVGAAILASLQTLIRPSEKAEIHRSRAAKYGTLRRRIEFFGLTEKHSDLEIEKFAKQLKNDWDNIASDSPLTPRNVRSKITKLLDKEINENHYLKNIKNSEK